MAELLSEYLPILIFLGIAIVVAAAAVGASLVLARQNPDSEKVSPYECGFEPFDDAGEFVAILLLDMRPEDLLLRLAEEVPILLFFVRELGGDGFEVVLDFGRQQVSMLETDLAGRTFQVHLHPAVMLAGARGYDLQARAIEGIYRSPRHASELLQIQLN